jgi:phenylalanyl-tRNA synthetase alpha chain
MTEGRLHPITVAVREIAYIFGRMGFGVAYGPELEDEWHNFTSLNVPADHPARDMQDTFWLGGGIDDKRAEDEKNRVRNVMRTHTSPVQMRYMEEQMAKGVLPPYRIIVPGKVFRNEATDATHEAQFFQNEGLVVGEGISLANLKGTLEQFFKEYLDKDAKVRFRPSFFPFTEPSVEVDVWFTSHAKGADGVVTKSGRWLEVMGAGMVHPDVLENAGIDSKKYQGFAFGGGIERLIMVKHGVNDVRLFHSGDLRFVYGMDVTEENKQIS